MFLLNLFCYLGTNPCALRDILKEAVKNFICPPALVSKSILSNQQVTIFSNSSVMKVIFRLKNTLSRF